MSEIEQLYEQIRARRAEIERLRAALDKEDAELAVTERNVARFLPNSALAAPISALVANIIGAVESEPARQRRKPKEVPRVLRMACDVLRESAANGTPWMEAPQITEEIRKRWWPEAQTSFIAPQLWRAATQRKVLVKDGARYALPHTIGEDPANEAGSSQANGALACTQ